MSFDIHKSLDTSTIHTYTVNENMFNTRQRMNIFTTRATTSTTTTMNNNVKNYIYILLFSVGEGNGLAANHETSLDLMTLIFNRMFQLVVEHYNALYIYV
jgi:hypothetical protein